MKDIVDKLSQSMLDLIKKNHLEHKEFLDIVEEAKLKTLEKIIGKGKFVLKKGGYIEKFSKDKIYYSLLSAADTIHEPLNSSDAHLVIYDVEQAMKQRSIISTDEIRKIVKGSLIKNGFSHISRSYR